MDRLELAWAAGFFDGDGWTARVTHRSTGRAVAQINQASSSGVPEVLVRFQAAVGGLGHIRGPKRKKGRKDLYWWFSTKRRVIHDIGRSLGPWLSPDKAAQFRDAVGLETTRIEGTATEELAWAAGFFDAEGSVCLLKHRSHEGYWLPEASVTQGCALGLPPELTRFRDAVGLGHLYGPMSQEGATEPIYRWKCARLIDVRAAIDLLDPWLGEVKRDQAVRVIAIVAGQTDATAWQPGVGKPQDPLRPRP